MPREEVIAFDSNRTRVITEDVVKANGEVKYAVGDVKDFPLPVWRDIARSVGKPLDEFSSPVDAAAVRMAVAESVPGKPVRGKAKTRRRAQLGA